MTIILKKGLTRRLFQRFMSDNFKRILFLASLTGYLENVHTPTKALADRVNRLLNVSQRPNSLTVAMVYNSKIWGGFHPEPALEAKGLYCKDLRDFINSKCLSVKEIRIISNVILESTPDYLRYGSKRVMRGDLFRLITVLNGESKLSLA